MTVQVTTDDSSIDSAASALSAGLGALLASLQARADNAYCDYIGLCRRDECLGWEAKTEKGIFGDAELKAHKDAAEKLGRHRALQEAANALHALMTPNVELTGAARLHRAASRERSERGRP